MIQTISTMEPTFGGINLEDIAAPECFEIERRLSVTIDIPVFHDDQHGTAIISGAALVNVARIADKDIGNMEIVFPGAGASAIASARFYVSLGVDEDNIVMCDSDGIITTDRVEHEDLNEFKAEFARDIPRGTSPTRWRAPTCSSGSRSAASSTRRWSARWRTTRSSSRWRTPTPRSTTTRAKSARDDTVIMATGRSGYPNQVNNVLGFSFIFRGALDVRATEINEAMKVAAAESARRIRTRGRPRRRRQGLRRRSAPVHPGLHYSEAARPVRPLRSNADRRAGGGRFEHRPPGASTSTPTSRSSRPAWESPGR